MKRLIRSGQALCLCVVLLVGLLAGCSSQRVPSNLKPEDYATTVVATFGDQKIYMNEANLFARLQQFYSEVVYSSFFGTDFWETEISSGVTLEATVKEEVMAAILQTYLLNSHAQELGVELSDADRAKVADAVKDFFATSDEKLIQAANVTEEELTQIYERNALANLVYQAIADQIDTAVSEEESRQLTVKYVLFKEETPAETQPADGETQAETDAADAETEPADTRTPKEKAQDLVRLLEAGQEIDDAVTEADGTVSTASFTRSDATQTGLAGECIKMATGENKVVEVEGTGFYAVHCVTDNDETATASKVEQILTQRRAAKFSETVTEWQKTMPEFKVVDAAWNQSRFAGNAIYDPETSTIPSEEGPEGATEEATEAATEADTEAATEADTETATEADTE